MDTYIIFSHVVLGISVIFLVWWVRKLILSEKHLKRALGHQQDIVKVRGELMDKMAAEISELKVGRDRPWDDRPYNEVLADIKYYSSERESKI